MTVFIIFIIFIGLIFLFTSRDSYLSQKSILNKIQKVTGQTSHARHVDFNEKAQTISYNTFTGQRTGSYIKKIFLDKDSGESVRGMNTEKYVGSKDIEDTRDEDNLSEIEKISLMTDREVPSWP